MIVSIAVVVSTVGSSLMNQQRVDVVRSTVDGAISFFNFFLNLDDSILIAFYSLFEAGFVIFEKVDKFGIHFVLQSCEE